MRPVLWYVVAFTEVEGSKVQGPQQPSLRSALKPYSFVELSCQSRLTCVGETAETRSQVGAVGTVQAEVLAAASFVVADAQPALNAQARYA